MVLCGSIIVELENVVKDYVHLHHITTSIKDLVLHLPAFFMRLRQARFRALDGISLKIYRGEVVGITGHNGAGKSTLLGIIAGVIKPTRGRVKVNGRVIPLLELGTGFEKDLTGRENIFLNGVLIGMTRKEIEDKLEDIIRFSELGRFINEPVRIYSSGMLARLGFSIAVHSDPDVLLIDEVLSVGDEQFRQKCIKKLNELHENGVTMVVVSHDTPLLKKLCDRIVYLEKGKIRKVEQVRKQKTGIF